MSISFKNSNDTGKMGEQIFKKIVFPEMRLCGIVPGDANIYDCSSDKSFQDATDIDFIVTSNGGTPMFHEVKCDRVCFNGRTKNLFVETVSNTIAYSRDRMRTVRHPINGEAVSIREGIGWFRKNKEFHADWYHFVLMDKNPPDQLKITEDELSCWRRREDTPENALIIAQWPPSYVLSVTHDHLAKVITGGDGVKKIPRGYLVPIDAILSTHGAISESCMAMLLDCYAKDGAEKEPRKIAYYPVCCSGQNHKLYATAPMMDFMRTKNGPNARTIRHVEKLYFPPPEQRKADPGYRCAYARYFCFIISEMINQINQADFG